MAPALSHVDWILTTGRQLGLDRMVYGLAERLCDAGVPLMRLRLSMRTTHPLTEAESVLWEADTGPITQSDAPHGLETRPAYIGSPMAVIAETGAPLRRKLTAPLAPSDHLVLRELRDRGATDYFGLPLDFVAGTGGMVIFVSNAPTGFSDADIDLLHRIANALCPIAEAHGNHRLATAIATSYLGARTGQRVLAGQITRGNIETIEAAILFSDIRGWTALNATRPASEALAIANTYFEVMSEAVDTTNGEILKFMGDGVLALFPSDGTDQGRQSTCRQAIAASHAAQGIAVLADLPVPFGIGIHYGEVLYGNVGARTRIDFTILGQAVNIASRVESFCRRLSQTILVSDTVAAIADVPMRHVSTQALKGLDTPMPLHTPST
ncbi:adenylate/guanylate cyclase domain-containing protein [uncultured Tateyamaria sp.]|uniref:adenylate/guanylate cyclase domain-containing protein n=1 Tax=uncultured Tateyamaria sp. TaxID=455651 RepID=UPI0026297719|nr:adenylate/guanylate cyclase domain-containing protein [uncultured Tateyamaria sp.]